MIKRFISIGLLLIFGNFDGNAQCSDIDFDCPNFELIVDLAVDTSGNLNLCEGEPITFINQTDNNLGAIDSFVWIWNYLGDPTSARECIITPGTDPVSHIYNFEDSIICARPNQEYVILSIGLSAIDTNGCFSLVQSNEILVNISPRALFNVTQKVCVGETIQFLNQSCPVTDNISFFWMSVPDGQTSTNMVPGFQYDEPGTYTVTLTTSTPICDFEDSYVLDIEVLPYPDPAFAVLNPQNGDSLCAGLDTLVVVNTSTNIDSFSWQITPAQDADFLYNSQGEDTAYVLMNAAGDYTLTLHLLNSHCAEDTTFHFIVLESAFLGLDGLPACWDQPTIDLSPFITINNGLPENYTIHVTYLEDLSVQVFENEIPTNVSLTGIGLYEIMVYSVSACGEVIRREVIAYYPIIEWTEPDVLCGEQDTVVNLNDYLIDRPDLCLQWSGNGVFQDSLFNPLSVGEGIYEITLLDCDSTCVNAMLELTVIGPSIPLDDISICLTDEYLALDELLEGQWTGIPVINDTVFPAIAGPGDYSLYFITDPTASCTVLDTIMISVRDTVQAAFAVNEPNCADSLFQFINLSGAPVIQWYFGEGGSSDVEDPTYQYPDPGTYFVSLVAGEINGGCQDSTVREVVVQEPPSASFGVTVDSVGCDSIHILLFATPTNAFLDFQWEINGNQILSGDSVIATIEALDTSQEITVLLLANNSCGSVLVSQPISIPPGFVADLIYDSEEIKCPGELVDFINISNNVDSFVIDYGNGIIAINEVLDLSFPNNTNSTLNYEVTIYGYNPNCGWDTGMVVVPVRPAVVIASTQFSDNTICHGEEITFINNSSYQDETILFFGDGGSAFPGDGEVITYEYDLPGIYSPWVVAHGCGSDTNYLDEIEVFALPDIQISMLPSQPCVGEAIVFVNSGSTISPIWVVDGDTVGMFTDTLLYIADRPGNHVLELIVTAAGNNFCTDMETIDFQVGSAIDLTASVFPVIGCAPLEVGVQLSSSVQNADYLIDFGNQQVSPGNVGSTIYASAGIYTLEAAAISTDGCRRDSMIVIEVLEEYQVEAQGDTIIMIGESVELDFLVNQPFETFNWSAGGELLGTNTVRPLADVPLVNTLYTIEVNGLEYNCSDSDNLLVHIICDELFLPDAFSPNNDGINDTYNIFKVFDDYNENLRNSCIQLIDWEVFDRWGERIFSAVSFDASWNGSFKGEIVDGGIYTLVVRYMDNLQQESEVTHKIHVLK